MTNRPSSAISALIASGAVGPEFSPLDIHTHLPQLDATSINNALSRMARAGDLKRSGTRNNRTYSLAQTSTVAILENLLSSLEEAKPALRQAIKILRAIEDSAQ